MEPIDLHKDLALIARRPICLFIYLLSRRAAISMTRCLRVASVSFPHHGSRTASPRDSEPNYDPDPNGCYTVCTGAKQRERHPIAQETRSYGIFEFYSPPTVFGRLAVGTA